jgi:TIR domain
VSIEASADFSYDVCLSFAGEQRTYVDEVADALQAAGVRVFYDDYQRAQLWGKDLYEHLDFIYRRAARYCVLFISKEYGEKLWTSHERRSAQARAFSENHEYVLPARFDDTEIPGIPPTIGYVSLESMSPAELATLIQQKVGPRQRDNFFPPSPDGLYERMGIDTDEERALVGGVAYKYFQSLRRMTDDEVRAVWAVIMRGCAAELPENMHISLDLLRREVEMPATQVLELLGSIRSLGFQASLRDDEDIGDHELTADDQMVVLSWSHMSSLDYPAPLLVAYAMTWTAAGHYCEHHALDAYLRRDFSSLASATAEPHVHD